MFKVKINHSESINPVTAFNELTAGLKSNEKPKFISFFSSIHFVKNNLVKELLKKIDEFYSKKVPITGGSFSGFISSEGCFVKGLALIAFFSDEIKIKTALGKNVKFNPDKTASMIINQIKGKKNVEETYLNNFFFLDVSNGVIPSLPFIGRKRIINMPLPDSVVLNLIKFFGKFFNSGVGREDELLESVSKGFPFSLIMSASTYDDNNSIENYQYFNSQILTNSAIGTYISSNTINFKSYTFFGLKPSNIKFSIQKKGLHSCAFSKINKKNAKQEFLNLLDWPNTYLDERIYRRTYYFPLGCTKGNLIEPHTIGLFLNNSICTTYSINSDELMVYFASGKKLEKEMTSKLTEIKKSNPLFVLGLMCTSYLETLGHNIYKIKELFDSFIGEQKYFILFTAGEGLSVNNSPAFFNHSVVLTSFTSKNK